MPSGKTVEQESYSSWATEAPARVRTCVDRTGPYQSIYCLVNRARNPLAPSKTSVECDMQNPASRRILDEVMSRAPYGCVWWGVCGTSVINHTDGML